MRGERVGMAYVREIVLDGHPALRKVAKKVTADDLRDPLFQQLIDDLFETMYEAPGIGLAAPQVAISKRLFVVDLQERDDAGEPTGIGAFVMINPKFTLQEGEIESTEGCLSIPGFIGEVPRFARVICTGLDRHGKKIEIEATGLLGRCLQHENDHLDGILYTDKVSNLRPTATDEAEADAESQDAVEVADHGEHEAPAHAAG